MEPGGLHLPVLLDQVLECLAPAPGETFVDCSFGAGGHARAILQRIRPGGLLLGLDQDAELLDRIRPGFQPDLDAGDLKLIHDNFEHLPQVVAGLGLDAVDGILLDLGVSSFQLDTAERGFSFRHEGRLDMRMDPGSAPDAAELVNRLPEKELADLIYRFGEERFSRRIARRIVETRAQRPIESTVELAELIARTVPRRGKIHPATRTFQALRIAVNRELEVLASLLRAAPALLRPGGRIAVISFHSLEDRIVKEDFRANRKAGYYRILTKKPIQADRNEVSVNPRARSAKLRAAIKVDSSCD